MTPIDFQNDERFSIAPPWMVARLVDVSFFSVGEDDSQSFHAVIVLKHGQKVGVSVYGRRWIKFNADDLKAVAQVLHVISQSEESNDTQMAADDETNEHRLQREKEATMNDKDDDQTHDIQAMRCEILGISAAECGGEKGVTLTVRANPNSFEVTELFFSLAQAQERLQVDLEDLLERSPVFKEVN